MSRIAVLHPQCSRVGGAIQMALQTVHALQKQGHTVTLYTFEKSDACFPDLQTGINIEKWHKKIGGKLISIITLAFHLRHFDIIIANNPPMQIVAALAKLFSQNNVRTLWWHHHIPWYLSPKNKIKSFMERHFIVPKIDQMIATSHFVSEKIQEYCGRESVVVHPVIQEIQNTGEMPKGMSSNKRQNDELLLSSNEGNRLNQLNALNNVTLFTHGRLEAGKGIDVLTRVFDKIKNSDKAPLSRGDAGKAEGFNTGKTNPPIENGITPPLDRGASQINLIIFGTGSLETKLREEGIDVRLFRGQETFQTLSSGQFGHVIGVYCSSIDAFGMASLESQMAGFPTIIMDRGGAREAILSDDDDQAVGYLVHSEEELLGTISRYVQNKILEKQMSNVNFSHKRDYFSTERLSTDLLSIITKIDQ